MKKYAKAIVALAGVCATLGAVGADGRITLMEALAIIESIAVAFGVYRVRNASPEQGA